MIITQKNGIFYISQAGKVLALRQTYALAMRFVISGF